MIILRLHHETIAMISRNSCCEGWGTSRLPLAFLDGLEEERRKSSNSSSQLYFFVRYYRPTLPPLAADNSCFRAINSDSPPCGHGCLFGGQTRCRGCKTQQLIGRTAGARQELMQEDLLNSDDQTSLIDSCDEAGQSADRKRGQFTSRPAEREVCLCAEDHLVM